LIAAAIVALGVTLAGGFTIDTYRGMRAQELRRHANTSKRDAILHLETSLRLLGWGIDPRYGIDMKYNCPATPCGRDSTTAFDEIVFVTRNPLYQWNDNGQAGCTTAGGCFAGNAWPIQSFTPGPPPSLTITLSAAQFLEKGRVVLAVCASAANPVMMTLSQSYTVPGAAVLTFNPAVAGDPYNSPNLLQSCHGQTGAGLFLVDRYRYFISNLPDPNPTKPNVPWLMLDTGMDLNNNGILPPADTNDLIPIAKNVEDMQIAYGLYGAQSASNCGALGPDANNDWIIGNSPGTVEEPIFAAAAPTYGSSLTDPSRCTMHPGNVRTIRVSLALRSDMVDTSRGPAWLGDTLPGAPTRLGAENRTGSLSGGQFRRYTAETSITLRNLDSIGSFMF
jgi:hypothetical protein